jgi:hypothetical protein
MVVLGGGGTGLIMLADETWVHSELRRSASI